MLSRCRAATAAIAVIGWFLLVSSCSAASVKGFSWTNAGSAIVFSQRGRMPEGKEGDFNSGHEWNRYVPAKPLRIGGGSAIEIAARCIAPGSFALGEEPRLRISVSPREDGTEPKASVSFPLAASLSSFVLPLPPGSTLASLSVTLEYPGVEESEAQQAEKSPVASILSVAIVSAFRGIAISGQATRVSSGFSLRRGRSFQELTIEDPFDDLSVKDAGGRKAGILLAYGSAPSASSIHIEAQGADGRAVSYQLRARVGGSRLAFGPGLFPGGTRRILLSAPASIQFLSFEARLLEREEEELSDLGRVLLSPPREPGADYDAYRWDILPDVTILDFRDYATQDRYLRRLAFFVEKAGYRGRLLGDAELQGKHGYNAHDYRPIDLAAFFEKARAASFPLLPEELALKTLLIQRGILATASGKRVAGESDYEKMAVAEGKGALLSISRESAAWQRRTLLVHESTHGILFTDAAYRDFVAASWSAVDPGERWFWKTYLSWAAYDTGSEYLMANEFQAYLLQQPLERTTEYFSKQKSAELLASRPELSERVEAYMREYGASFAARAAGLGFWLESRYGAPGGNAIFLERAAAP